MRMKYLLIRDLTSQLDDYKSSLKSEKSYEYLEWISSDIVSIVNEFVQKNKLHESYFIKNMNSIFNTTRFEPLSDMWIMEYFMKLFGILQDSSELSLENNSLNRFGVEKYYSRFKILPKINWKKRSGIVIRSLNIILRCYFIVFLSLNRGIRLRAKKKQYKVMREAIWGLYNTGGYYFHDDFLVDGSKIKKEGLLLYSRGIPSDYGRLKGYYDAKKSPYAHFNLIILPIGIGCLFKRIVPKYIFSGARILSKEISSDNFSLYWSIFLHFVRNALHYEKVFSNFKIYSELGHNYFSSSHIVESIICQNYGVKYYLMHWSDHSLSINKYIVAFLGCDGFLSWGNIHMKDTNVNQNILILTGYVFKRFIKEVSLNKSRILAEMGINSKGKIISFFDESFGNEVNMTGENYVVFWDTISKQAEKSNNTILIKPKDLKRYNKLGEELRKRFIHIKDKLSHMPNVYIIDPEKWSFIEVIGVSDLVITQGMTTSATIAIVCGIQGLYLNQSNFSHSFSKAFKDIIVFSEQDKLLEMASKIISGRENIFSYIPEAMLRDFDAYPDDRGIDMFRDILTNKLPKKVGIVIQARMGSTRLPGKVIKPILGKPMLEILISRLRRSKKTDIIIIATSQKKNDDVIENLANKLGVACFRGDEEDVLSRYYEAAKKYNLDVVVRVTSDCPLSDPLLIDSLINYYLDNLDADYVANIIKRTYPRGFDIEVFSFKSLEKAAKEATKPYEREHVTPFISENSKVLNYQDTSDASQYRVTVDTPEDFQLITEIFKSLDPNKQFGYKQVVDLLDSRPDLVAINQHVEQKAIAR